MNGKRYWRSLHDPQTPQDDSAAPAEFRRRGFLQALGFTFAGAVLSGCRRAPEEKAVPYLTEAEEIIPGRALFYASTCDGCPAGCGILAKCVDGRPVKLEGNPEHPASRGGLCAIGQASLLGLYDSHRLSQPLEKGQPASWEHVDHSLMSRLASLRKEGGAIRFLTGTINSPTTQATLQQFLKQFPGARHVVYDPLSSSAILEAHQRTHSARLLPRYHFEKAQVIVSLDADFLGTWISPVEFTAGYQAGRALESKSPSLSYHVQCESRLSLTGMKADRRFLVAPGEMGLLATHLAAQVARMAGEEFAASGLEPSPVPLAQVQEIARKLWAARGRSLVVSGSQDVVTQVLVNFLNHLLGNYGATLDLEHPSFQRQGDDRQLQVLAEELEAGQVAALFMSGVNPAYDAAGRMAPLLRRTPLLVCFDQRLTETAELAHYVCPVPHGLESWGDCEATPGVVSLFQPAIKPFGQTRTVAESLAAWMGTPRPAYDLLRAHWETSIFPRQTGEQSFQTFWDRSVEMGFAEVAAPRGPAVGKFNSSAAAPIQRAQRTTAGEFALVLYPTVALLDGRHAYNPWLQELPDPITKVTWDNYVSLSPAAATRLGVSEGDVVTVGPAAAPALDLPVVVQPGQHDGVAAVALGYGGKMTERFAGVGPQWLEARSSVGDDGRVGRNAAAWVRLDNGAQRYDGLKITVQRTGKQRPLACTQTHHFITVPERLAPPGGIRRPIIEETTLDAYRHELAEGKSAEEEPHEELWPQDHPYPGHRWAMAIDLNACTGCGACVIACQAENNIPVVGRDEVRRRREMHWLRIDRYYAGEGADLQTVHQPMLCQQCENAPCETVCPVLATVHSEEGLNQQVYNRCVGTRYCANNCPYKVRRFNWFNYPRADQRQNLVLNPDVAVRSRGVMEKCTFCVQRIQEAKSEAKSKGEPLRDGAIQPACQQSCPAGGIVFGDLNDPQSRVAQLVRSPRRYRVLEELDVRPSVNYLKVVRHG